MAKQKSGAKQLYWEDIDIGTEVTPLKKVATTQMLVQWAGATGDFNPLHYDYTFATSVSLQGPLVHGLLKGAWLVQLVTDWIGEKGKLVKHSRQYRGLDYPRPMKLAYEPGEEEAYNWSCKGTVTNKYIKDGEHYVECDIWVENSKGEKTTPGSATAILPSRG